jgi:hypothetical protein
VLARAGDRAEIAADLEPVLEEQAKRKQPSRCLPSCLLRRTQGTEL